MLATHQKKRNATKSDWRKIFALDYRSLAFYRILIGILILADLVLRLPEVTAMCTDDGYMTLDVVKEYYQHLYGFGWQYATWSFHWLSGSAWLQYILFGITATFAILFALGWKTRLVTIGCWAMVSSLHVRNPLILTSGDTILRVMLFWSMFLPLGRVWSLDAKQRPEPPTEQSALSIGSIAFILQLIVVYFFSGLAKCNSQWFSGEALEHVLRLKIYVLPFGAALLDYPLLLIMATYATLLAEAVLIWWLFSTRRNDLYRVMLIGIFISFHIGIGLTLAISHFAMVCIAVWLALLPSQVWNWFGKTSRLSTKPQFPAAPLSEFKRKGWPQVSAVFCSAAILFVVILNIANIERPNLQSLLPGFVRPFGVVLNLDQRFQMFGSPPKMSPWFVYEAQLADGTFVDLMRTGPERIVEHAAELHESPEDFRAALPSLRWRKLHRNLVHPERSRYRAPLIEYATRKWNAEHGSEQQVIYAKLVCYLESTNPNTPSKNQSNIWATIGNPVTAQEAVVDDALNQLLGDENPDLLPF